MQQKTVFPKLSKQDKKALEQIARQISLTQYQITKSVGTVNHYDLLVKAYEKEGPEGVEKYVNSYIPEAANIKMNA